MALTDTVREALDAHERTRFDYHAQAYGCACGALVYTEAEHRAHQAEAVAAALTKGGHVEFGIEWDDLAGGSYVESYSSEQVARSAYDNSYSGALQTVSRVVGPWEAS